MRVLADDDALPELPVDDTDAVARPEMAPVAWSTVATLVAV
jgi:hypothetical protein